MEVSDSFHYKINYARVEELGIVGMIVASESGKYILGWIHPPGSRLATPIGAPLTVPRDKAIVIDYGTPLLISPKDLKKLCHPGTNQLVPGVGPFTSAQIPAGLFHPLSQEVTALVGRMPRVFLRPLGNKIPRESASG